MTSGSDFEQFMKQPLVPALFGMTCFFGILLILSIVLIIYMRQRRARKDREAMAVAAGPGYATAPNLSEHEMPDLDLLVSTPPVPAAAALQPVSMPVSAPAPAPQPPAPVRAARKGTFTVAPQDGPIAEAVEVMTVLRDIVDGRLIIQMGDKVYQNVASTPEFRDRFNRVMRELAQITSAAGGAPAPVVAASDHVVIETEPVTAEEQIDRVVEPPPAPKPRPASPPPPIPTGGVLPGDLPSFKLDDNPLEKLKGGMGRLRVEQKPIPSINIAGAIEAYLQYKLQHSPEYAGHSIHIHPAPDGGVSIEADGKYYDAVSDVADPNIREFIAQAIQEWQERH